MMYEYDDVFFYRILDELHHRGIFEDDRADHTNWIGQHFDKMWKDIRKFGAPSGGWTVSEA